MSHQRIHMDQLPAQLCDASGDAFSVRELVEATEHNIEDLLLCLEALRTDDVPHVNWDWDQKQWQPELINDDHYPQCYVYHTASDGTDYHIVWSVPLCRRDQSREWHDGEHYFEGIGRQVLLFDYQLKTAAADQPAGANQAGSPAQLLGDSISVFMGTHEGVPLRRILTSEKGNRIRVDTRLLIELAESIDELKAFLKLEAQALSVLHRRTLRLKERELHSNE